MCHKKDDEDFVSNIEASNPSDVSYRRGSALLGFEKHARARARRVEQVQSSQVKSSKT
jgi:hypothetical protein